MMYICQVLKINLRNIAKKIVNQKYKKISITGILFQKLNISLIEVSIKNLSCTLVIVFKIKKSNNNLVNELKEYAENYISINYFCEETELEICFKRFRLLGVSTAVPLLLHFYDIYKKDEKFPFERFYRVLRMTESFIIRRTIVGARTRGYGEDFAEAIEKSKTIEIWEGPRNGNQKKKKR